MVAVHVQTGFGRAEETHAAIFDQKARQREIAQNLRSFWTRDWHSKGDIHDASRVGAEVPILVIAMGNGHGRLDQDSELAVDHQEVFVRLDLLDKPAQKGLNLASHGTNRSAKNLLIRDI